MTLVFRSCVMCHLRIFLKGTLPLWFKPSCNFSNGRGCERWFYYHTTVWWSTNVMPSYLFRCSACIATNGLILNWMNIVVYNVARNRVPIQYGVLLMSTLTCNLKIWGFGWVSSPSNPPPGRMNLASGLPFMAEHMMHSPMTECDIFFISQRNRALDPCFVG